MISVWFLIALFALMVLGWILWKTATRIDKLHRKVVAAKISLDQQLQRRAGAAIDLAVSGLLDPASALLIANEAYAIADSLDPIGEPEFAMELKGLSMARELGESELSSCLRQVFPDETAITDIRANPIGDELMYRLVSTWYRCELVRRFHNQAVADARALRRHWWVRVFHLAGHAELPETCELDDAMSPALAAAAVVRANREGAGENLCYPL
ncbi:MAG: hypothetical protein LBB58_05765 [Cellulomonadaceae bacterium]|jgi:hypothetical protein|nr:hypothetical protein [Cellulomonadaceae bacterium]